MKRYEDYDFESPSEMREYNDEDRMAFAQEICDIMSEFVNQEKVEQMDLLALAMVDPEIAVAITMTIVEEGTDTLC